MTLFFSELCSHLICGKNAIKTVAVSDMSSCHCACPKYHQGDPNIECKGNHFCSRILFLKS